MKNVNGWHRHFFGYNHRMGNAGRWLPLAVVAAALWGCGEGGCGDEEPKTQQREPTATGGAAGKGGGSSSGEGIKLSPFDANKNQARAAQPPDNRAAAAPPPRQEAPRAPPAAAAQIEEVTSVNFQPRVLKAVTLVLLFVYESPCEACDTVAPVLTDLAAEYKGRVALMKLNGQDPESRAKLPKGLLLTPYPGFLLYDKGEVRSWRQGLPLKSQKGEELPNYRSRLADWFRGAFAKKKLG